MVRKWLFAVVISSLALAAQAQTLSDEGKESITAWLQEAAENTRIPGMVALVVNRDGILYQGSFGQRDVGRDLPMTDDTIFRIASMTKPVTSLAVMMLVEEGRVTLDDPIEKYLPELGGREVFATFDYETGAYTARPAATSITIRHLLTHTSGLGYAFASREMNTLIGSDFSASATAWPLMHDPGAAWSYGESTRVLGRLVEVVSGEELFAFMQQRILVPLQMHDTFYDVPVAKNVRLATTHAMTDGTLVETPNPEQTTSAQLGDGGLSSTAADYSRFIRLFLNSGQLEGSGQLLSEAGIADMGRNHSAVKVRLMESTNTSVSMDFPLGAGVDSFGLGFQITESALEYMRGVGSMAWAGIYNTEFWIDPGNGIGAVLMMQYLPFYDDAAIDTLVGFEQRIYQHLEP